jgi:hypothetical protein
LAILSWCRRSQPNSHKESFIHSFNSFVYHSGTFTAKERNRNKDRKKNQGTSSIMKRLLFFCHSFIFSLFFAVFVCRRFCARNGNDECDEIATTRAFTRKKTRQFVAYLFALRISYHTQFEWQREASERCKRRCIRCRSSSSSSTIIVGRHYGIY